MTTGPLPATRHPLPATRYPLPATRCVPPFRETTMSELLDTELPFSDPKLFRDQAVEEAGG
jgi:hypothetical protein